MLQQSEQKLRNIFEPVADGVFTMDMNGVYTEVNQAMLDMHRLTSKNDLIGVNAFDCVAPSNMEEARAGMEQTTREGAIVTKQFISRRLGDGSEFPVEISAKLLTDAWGNATGFVGIARDVSQRKQGDEEKQKLEQKAQLASRLASVGELAAGIAHEINNPLTSVIGYAQLLSGEENIPDDMRKDLKAIIEGANRVAGIVKRLLTFARQTKPQQTLVSIADLVTSTVELRAYHLRNDNIKVTTQFDPELPVITADPGQLQQVFLNLIVNAEIEMKRAHGKGKLLITAEKVGKTIRISFKDDGPGIAKENLDRIFHPFFTTKEVGEGTGLGLSICYGIVSEHGGRIWAESQPGKGATFIVELPVVARASQPKPAKPKEEKVQKVAKAKILAVDDEPMILQLLGRLLAEEGYRLDTVDNAADAMKMIDKERYNLILLDIKMPDMSGIELYERLQKIAPSLARRVMFITGDVMGPETEAFLSQARAPYVTKPFDASKLKKEVRRLLSRG
ncbi:MAG: response regulator, partial [Chloroflexi bacterium]|nr:response regulator [Chloroflexota bacterium]